MTLAGLLVHDVTILHPGTSTSRYGDEVRDWATGTSTALKGWLAPATQDEVEPGRDAQVATWTLTVPAGTDIDGDDRVEWNGITFEVDGPPAPAWTPRGEHHIEVRLRTSTG